MECDLQLASRLAPNQQSNWNRLRISDYKPKLQSSRDERILCLVREGAGHLKPGPGTNRASGDILRRSGDIVRYSSVFSPPAGPAHNPAEFVYPNNGLRWSLKAFAQLTRLSCGRVWGRTENATVHLEAVNVIKSQAIHVIAPRQGL